VREKWTGRRRSGNEEVIRREGGEGVRRQGHARRAVGGERLKGVRRENGDERGKGETGGWEERQTHPVGWKEDEGTEVRTAEDGRRLMTRGGEADGHEGEGAWEHGCRLETNKSRGGCVPSPKVCRVAGKSDLFQIKI